MGGVRVRLKNVRGVVAVDDQFKRGGGGGQQRGGRPEAIPKELTRVKGGFLSRERGFGLKGLPEN